MDETKNKSNRIGLHSHLTTENNLLDLKSQNDCLKALTYIKTLVKKNKSNLLVVIKGESGTGKTILVKETFKDDFLMHSISSIEVNTKSISPAEFMTQAIRKSIKLRVKEVLKVIEGEVFSLTNTKIGIKTIDMESIFEIGDKMIKQIQKEKIVVGDIIRIIKERGKIIKLGVHLSKMEPDLLGDLTSLACPEGELFKTIEEIQIMTLHDIDCLNNRTHGYLNLYDGETGEISQEVRNEVDEKIKKWILEGKVEVERGILIIDNVQILDDNILKFINKLSEQSLSPTILLIENGKQSSRVTELLDTALFVNVENMEFDGYTKIIESRLRLLKMSLEPDTIHFLGNLAVSYGINYAINILDICASKAINLDTNTFNVDDVKRIVNLLSFGIKNK